MKYYTIYYDLITFCYGVVKKLINIYNDFIENPFDAESIENEVKPDSKMGYISNVNDARKKLEDDWKRPNSNKES